MSSKLAPPTSSTQPSTPSSPPSPATGPTAEAPCGSTTTASGPSSTGDTTSTESPASAPSSSAIRYEDRVFLTGRTGCGKSTLARALFLSVAAPRLVIDPLDSSMTTFPGEVTFSDPTRATNPQGENWREAATARFVPHDHADLDAYDAMYRWAFARFPRYVWLDEAADAMPAHQTRQVWARKYLIHGRKRSLGHMACHTRPVEVNRNLIAQAAHLFIFDTPHPADRRALADNMGFPLAQLEQHLVDLDEYGFLWWDQRAKTLRICPPL